MHSTVSVIIPCLNEAAALPKTLESVAAQGEHHEIVIVDGGSEDATPDVAQRYGRLLRADPGRARQMNAGAAQAAGDTLLFLHADTILPPDALSLIRRTLDDPSHEGGAFRLRFDRPTPLLRLYSSCTRFSQPRLCFGDRGLFVRRRVFEELGGFPPLPLFEDLEMVRLLHERGGFVFLKEYVTTSARRFHRHGPLRQQLRNTYLWLHYVAGTDPRRLVGYYPYD